MNTKPIKALLKKYHGNLLEAPISDLVKALKLANGDLEKLIEQAEKEYNKEKPKQNSLS